jgi:protoporphyrinogen oxidase
MRRMGLISGKDDIEAVNIIDIPYAYVIFDNRRINALEHIRGALERMGIYSAGRFGSWEYLSMEDAFMDGWTAAEKMLKSRG